MTDGTQAGTTTHLDRTVDLGARARRHIPGGVNSGQRQIAGLQDLVVEATSGATFRDSRGKTFTDYHAAFGPPLLGHNDPDVDAAVARTSREQGHAGVGVTPLEIELAETLCQLVPSLEQVLLTSTGSEATFQAIRVSRAATGRRHVIKFQGCYHGWHDAVAMNVISQAERVGGRDPLSREILPEVLEATIVCPFNDLEAVASAMARYDVAAVIVEPIPHNIGCVLPLPAFLPGLRQLCSQHGAVLIFDEVITGFRHALGGYQSICDVVPDLTTLGKAMGNGYPIAAVGGRSDLMQLFSTTPGRPAFFAGTFNGHPAMVAAALATIRKIERDDVHEHVFRLGGRARSELQAMYDRIGVKAAVTGFGSVFVTFFLEGAIERYDDLLRNDANLFCAYRLELMQHGIFELPLNLKRSHVSFAHSDDDIDALVQGTEASIRTVLHL